MGSGADSCAAQRVCGKPKGYVGQLANVARVKEDAGLAITDDLARPFNAACEEHPTARLGLEVNQRLAFGLGGHHDDVGKPKILWHLRVFDPAREPEAIFNALPATLSLQLDAPWPVPDDNIEQTRIGLQGDLRRG